MTLDDGTGTCLLRFFSFYPSQQKALAVGNLIRVQGEVRGGFAGLTMMHPVVKPAGAELAAALTPVYPTVAGLPQAYLRRAVQGGAGQVTSARGSLFWLCRLAARDPAFARLRPPVLRCPGYESAHERA